MSGPNFVYHSVADRTTLSKGYMRHASHQSMAAYLADWEKALVRLRESVEVLRGLHAARQSDTERGVWPPSQGSPIDGSGS